jgi:heme/copper-type cytochrome/quinol oxidase subunit 2
MGILIAVVILAVVKLGPLPGNIAKKRGHPQADAINVLGWIGVITLGVSWLIALVWAFTRSAEQHSEYLTERIAALESELAILKSNGGDA